MIDAATPLLGMVMRMHTLSGSPLPDKLYQQVVTDIQAIEQQLQSQGYEPGAIVSFRYVLCTFIDETALGLGWNTDNGWGISIMNPGAGRKCSFLLNVCSVNRSAIWI